MPHPSVNRFRTARYRAGRRTHQEELDRQPDPHGGLDIVDEDRDARLRTVQIAQQKANPQIHCVLAVYLDAAIGRVAVASGWVQHSHAGW